MTNSPATRARRADTRAKDAQRSITKTIAWLSNYKLHRRQNEELSSKQKAKLRASVRQIEAQLRDGSDDLWYRRAKWAYKHGKVQKRLSKKVDILFAIHNIWFCDIKEGTVTDGESCEQVKSFIKLQKSHFVAVAKLMEKSAKRLQEHPFRLLLLRLHETIAGAKRLKQWRTADSLVQQGSEWSNKLPDYALRFNEMRYLSDIEEVWTLIQKVEEPESNGYTMFIDMEKEDNNDMDFDDE